MAKMTKYDFEKKKFESDLLKAFSAKTKFGQINTLRVCREYADFFVAAFNDGYSAEVAVEYFVKSIGDVNKLCEFKLSVGPVWR